MPCAAGVAPAIAVEGIANLLIGPILLGGVPPWPVFNWGFLPFSQGTHKSSTLVSEGLY